MRCVGGLALNLTPCVYPVIPLTIGFFGGQSRRAAAAAPFGLAALYVLGMATMYSALGVAAALSGRLFGAALQSPWVLAVVAAVLVALALSMFGLYDIRMPTSWMQKAGARPAPAGAYGMGLLVGVVAAPCIGPVRPRRSSPSSPRGRDAAFGFLVLLRPLARARAAVSLPRARSPAASRACRAPAMWMESVKKIFGWVLLAMAAYFLRPVLPARLGAWLLPAVLASGPLAIAFGGRRLGGLATRACVSAAVRPVLARRVLLRAARAAAASAPGVEALRRRDRRDGRTRPPSSSSRPPGASPASSSTRRRSPIPACARRFAARPLEGRHDPHGLRRKSSALARSTRSSASRRSSSWTRPGTRAEELRLVGFEGPDEFLTRLEKAP